MTVIAAWERGQYVAKLLQRGWIKEGDGLVSRFTGRAAAGDPYQKSYWYGYVSTDPGRGWFWCVRREREGGNVASGNSRNAWSAAKAVLDTVVELNNCYPRVAALEETS